MMPSIARVEVRPFFVHQWLDVADSSGKWYEAQVIAIESKGTATDATNIMGRIHYKGLHARYDEWLQYGIDRARYDVLYTHTTKPRVYGTVLQRVGVACDMLDTTDAWLTATICAINNDTKQLQIHYTDWGDKYNEWVDMDTPRLAPRGTFTKKTVATAIGAAAAPTTTTTAEAKAMPSPIVAVEESKGGFAATVEDENKYRELLRTKNGFMILSMASDGNCLFRSVSNSVYGTPDHHAIVRAKCMEYMVYRSSSFANISKEIIINNDCFSYH
jgi:hypothetical protein